MFKYSKESLLFLNTCEPRLVRVANEVIKYRDCKVLEGHRGQALQDEYFRTGRSKLPWPRGEHNALPSRALDLAPYPVIWPDRVTRPKTYTKDLCRWYAFGGFVLGIAAGMGIPLRAGFDWDGDLDLLDQNFDDLPHFELIT